MASAQEFNSLTTPYLKDVIYCGWCKGNLSLSTKLVQFDCLHHGCVACLTQNQQDLRPGTLFSCPQCNLSCIVPPGGAAGFPEEPLLMKMRAIADIHANKHPSCQSCQQLRQTRNSSNVCVTCKVYLCEEDAVRHRVLPDHEIITIQELQSEPYLSKMIQTKADLCQKHASEKRYFCKDCQEQICMDCVVLEHSTHKKITVEDAATDSTTKIEAGLRKLEKAENMVRENIQKSTKDQDAIQMKLRESIGNNTSAKRSSEIITMMRTTRMRRNNAAIFDQVLLKKIGQFQMAQQYIRIFLKYCSKTDIIRKNRFLIEVIEDYLTEQETRNNQAQMITDVPSLGVNLSNSSFTLTTAPRTTASTPALSFVPTYKTTATGGFSFSSLNSSSVPTAVSPNVSIIGLSGKPTKELEKAIEPSVENYKKKPESWENRLKSCTLESKWEASDNRGVALDGEDVLIIGWGNTIHKFGINGTKKDGIICPNLKMPCDIDVCRGEIYITDKDDRKRNVLVIDKNGQETKQIELPPKEHIGSSSLLLPLAVDQSNGNIVIGSQKRNLVYKYTGDGQVMEWITEGISWVDNICITPGSNLITSHPTFLSGYVCKFDKTRKFQWKYDSKISGDKPGAVCSDHTGQIFVADFENHRIHIVSPHGQFLCFVDIGEEILSPQAMTFKDGRLVVTTDYKNTVYVIKCNYN